MSERSERPSSGAERSERPSSGAERSERPSSGAERSSVGGRAADRLVQASLAGTAAFAIAATAAALRPAALGTPVAVLDVSLFLLGCAAFLWTLLRAAERSRAEQLSVAGIWFLAGSAPAAVRTPMLGALVVQVVVGVATAAARPFTPLAFGILVPLYGLGLAGAWGAASGRFPRRAAGGGQTGGDG